MTRLLGTGGLEGGFDLGAVNVGVPGRDLRHTKPIIRSRAASMSAAYAAGSGTSSGTKTTSLETARIGVICGASACPEVKQAQVP